MMGILGGAQALNSYSKVGVGLHGVSTAAKGACSFIMHMGLHWPQSRVGQGRGGPERQQGRGMSGCIGPYSRAAEQGRGKARL